MSPPAASSLNRSTDSNARCPLRSPGWMTSMDTYGRCRAAPDLLRQDIKNDRPLILGMLVHNQLGELLLTGLSTRQVRDTDLLDRHGWPPRFRIEQSIAKKRGLPGLEDSSTSIAAAQQ